MGRVLVGLPNRHTCHGATLHTTDQDFSRFPGLRWTNPLLAR